VIAALSSEWLKLRTTRTLFWLLVALAALISLIVFAGIGTTDAKDISAPRDQLGLLGLGAVAIFIALLIGLIVSTGEFRHGTITSTLLATPSRPRVVLAKGVAGMLFAVALVVLAEGLVIAELALLLPAKGVDIVIETGPTLKFLGWTFLAAALWGAIGSGIGIIIKNQIGAVVSCFTWLFVIEGLINALLRSHLIDSHAGRFLPFQATVAILHTGTHNPGDLLSHAGGAVTLSVWMLLAIAGALLLLGRRDVS
jgi:ABC-type transport system involved in multi-copper enzyme maturation permease subunit